MISPEKITNGSNGTNGSSTGCRDGNDYLKVLNKERNRLIADADKWDAEIDDLLKANVSEEIVGHVRAATGKARLLASQKMVQFEGLCNKNINPPQDDTCPTKLQDLQGFWDMLLIQVDNIDHAFGELETMRANGWQLPAIVNSPTVCDGVPRAVRRITPKSTTPSPAALLAAQKRDAQRKQLAELKRKLKLQQQKSDENSSDGLIH